MEGGEAGNESECRLLACGSMSIIVLGNGRPFLPLFQ